MDLRATWDRNCHVELQLNVNGKPTKYWELTQDGPALLTTTRTGSKPPKSTTKTLDSEQKARVAYDKTVRAKMRSGYVYLHPYDEASFGDVVFAGYASGSGAGALFDLSLDGQWAVTAGSNSNITKCWLALVNTLTGERKTVYEKQIAFGQLFLHTACFDACGENIVYSLNDQTNLLHIETGESKTIAEYLQFTTARFNPFVVRPHFDHQRKRLVVFDAHTKLRVLDEHLKTYFEIDLDHPTTECRAAKISGSGQFLAVYRISRGLVYSHNDALYDHTNEVDVWDLEKKSCIHTIEMDKKVDKVSLSADDKALLVSWEYAQGPVCIDLATQKIRWLFDDPTREDRLDTAYGWAHSPNGTMLAVARGTGQLYRASDREPIAMESTGGYSHRSSRITFSGDGKLMGMLEDGCMVIRKVQGS
jgi:predicted DNA-binding WGR domain protein/WD40 repeat protein